MDISASEDFALSGSESAMEKVIGATLKETGANMSAERVKQILKYILTHADTLASIEEAMAAEPLAPIESEKITTSICHTRVKVKVDDENSAKKGDISGSSKEMQLLRNNEESENFKDINHNLENEKVNLNCTTSSGSLRTFPATEMKVMGGCEDSLPASDLFCFRDDESSDNSTFQKLGTEQATDGSSYRKYYPKISFHEMNIKRKRSCSPLARAPKVSSSSTKIPCDRGTVNYYFQASRNGSPSDAPKISLTENCMKVEGKFGLSVNKTSENDNSSMVVPSEPSVQINECSTTSIDYEEITLKGGVETPGKNLGYQELDVDDSNANQEVISAVCNLNNLMDSNHDESISKKAVASIPKQTPDKKNEKLVSKTEKDLKSHRTAGHVSRKETFQNSVFSDKQLKASPQPPPENMDWNRDQDKQILLVCQKLGTTEEAFRLASKAVGVTNPVIVKKRFQELMDDIKKALKKKS